MGERPPTTEVMPGRCIPTRQIQVDRNHTASSRDNITAEEQPLTEVTVGPNNGQSDDKTPTLLGDFEERANGRAANEVPADQRDRVMADKPHTAYNKDDDTAERQSLPDITNTPDTQVARRQRPHKPPLLRILLWIQALLYIAPLLTIVFYMAIEKENEDRTTRQFKDKSAILLVLIGGYTANAVDLIFQAEIIGKKPMLVATTYSEWAMETARFTLHFYSAFMYMVFFSQLYGGSKGHAEPLSGTNGTVCTNGTGGVQKTIGF
ncbi:hypothetical protein LTR10_021895 [Elasticomyces elasticus]|uniref:Uncharacterized protein n=1 Tax=Exophiala sideris TaxID=1016849 RepID=A0ABR0JQD2_9EURO|nr:hypothetical protein LTR10_021895 [Elasticomyces elasticus]KAK5039794.1 hypothetical protein LTS07_000289 [Exophiala sideris]KAK5041346.1 hypothetical protein LTR13_002821 [Exophiala sideris]KAK5068173.1 hypothetical protein LTR69_000291 [Exophiala sideris]KAK5187474.1 hypothetical protein LTR44_000290 [Eurotiomycetes sp. CCFEE 6388]